MPITRTGGGTFDPHEENVYFIASDVDRMRMGSDAHQHLLIAVNELRRDHDLELMEQWASEGRKIFVDSGIFWLTNEHKRKHGITMDEALALAPEEIDNFDWLWNRYLEVVRRLESCCWGYIELDQGGRENKIRTRARLEALGLKPIPVYHPFNDGWDYFDYLAERYDRVCFGNVVQADIWTRKRLIATAWERVRRHPHLWVHLLGYTPNETLYARPISSGDSSTWLSAVRWNGYIPRTCGRPFGHMPKEFSYRLGSDPLGPDGSWKATKMSAFGSNMAMLNWRNHVNALRQLGINPRAPIEQSLDAQNPTMPRNPNPILER